MRKKALLCLGITLAMGLSSCSIPSANQEKKQGITVVCSIFPQYDWCREIMGDQGNLELLMQNGTDLHSYEPTAKDILTLSDADLFIYVGGTSDNWVEHVVASAENPDLNCLSMMDCVTVYDEELVEGMEEDAEDSEDDEKESDEHIWLSLKNAEIICQEICDRLCEADAENSETYQNNLNAYLQKLDALDQKYTAMMDSAERKSILVADRFPFRYLAEDYGIDYYAAFPGCSADANASFETMQFLIDKTKELELQTIFKIDDSDGTIATKVAVETGAKISVLHSCQSITTTELNTVSYLSQMEANYEAIHQALNK